MLDVLTNDILPVFSMLALGFLLGRAGKVHRAEATAVNRIAFLVLQPALIFPLVNGLDWSAFRLDAIALYACCQAILFASAFFVAYRLLRRDMVEAWLLAMATIFVNTLLYIWPISFLIYGEKAATAVTGIVAWDATVTFAFFIVTTDLLVNRASSPMQSLRRVAANPVLIAIALGVLGNVATLPTPAPVLTAMEFAGAGAAPLTLFALGVILSGHSLMPTPTVITISSLKLLVFPALVWAALQVGQRPEDWNSLLLLCAAGPSGAMAFSLGVLHGVRTDQLAPVIIWTSTLSLFSLAFLA
ncbi:malonate transporter [Rhodovulum iodosum]|uniref:Malonate transporter n=1 Tax=Rhodovulum iodosum TaxID=68291 RepID=A0ABV3XW59_9RHOB|nr:AEC family transporter [Rhodovulum robiginosum]RSK36726.1 malonate transporter [Rhodovulum robiginosum]